jgi:capsular polysaccharide biosynthesis protein
LTVDLLAIVRKVWRHKLVTVPVIVLTICGAAYVLAVKEPLYEASSSYLLINPPTPPTAEEIARFPALGRVRSDNPYTRFADQSVVVDVLARSMSSESARRALVRAGADPRYTVASAARFGSANPIVQITGTGPTPQTAIRTANVVGHAVTGELDRMQRVKQVASRYRITALQVEVPEGAQLRASGQLRMLIAVLALGAILLFIVISITDALATLRQERRQHVAVDWAGGPLDELRPAQSREDEHDRPVPANGRAVGRPENREEQPWASQLR